MSTDAIRTAEEAPLLFRADAHGPPPVFSETPLPSKAFRYKVISLCILFVFLIDLSGFLIEPPVQAIIEDVVCYIHYPDHRLAIGGGGGGGDTDPRCKSPDVQKMMTSVKAITIIPDFLFPLLVQFSYGRAADKYGRRLVLRLANLGVTLSLSADAIILAFPDTFSIWLMVPASLFLLIGGGSTMVGAMVYTMVSDITPVADRASIFYLLMAFALILNAVLTPLSGLLMTRSIWLPAWLGLAACWAGTAVSYILPETSPILLAKAKGKLLTEEHEEEHGEATATNVEGGEEQARGDGITRTAGKGNGNGKGILSNAWFGFRSDFSNIYRFLISDGRIMVFTILTALHYPYLLGMSVFFYQFVSGHFALPWHQITYVATISRVTSVVVLLGILPIVSRLMSRFGGRVAEPLRRDMYLLRASAVLLCAGCLLLGLAPNKWFIMASQVVYGLSAGYTPLARALAISLVEPHMLATLNTALAALEAIMTVVAAPVLGWLIGVGDDLNGVLGGLAYIVLGALAFGGMMTTFCLRVPINKVEAGGA